MRSEGLSSTPSGPIKALSLALGVTALALGGLAWNAVTSSRRIEDMKRRDLRIESLRGRIVYLDEVLTMSARMAAATGDSQWEARHRRFEPELDRAIREALSLAPEAGAVAVVARTQAANTALIEMENRAFELIRQKRLEDARATLFSKEYDRLKVLYADGMHTLDAALKQSVRRTRVREFGRVRFVLIISAAILPVLFISWFIALRTMNRWKATLAQNQDRRSAQTAELAQLNADLDRKVAARTGELERSREESLQGLEALRESTSRQRAIFEAAFDATITMDHHGEIVEFNPAAERIFQYARKEAVGQPLAELIIPSSLRERHRQGLARFLQTGKGAILGRRIEMSAIRKDGEEFPVELTITRINVEGPPVFAGFLRDLTEHKRAEKKILRSEERFRRLFDSKTIGIVVSDLTGKALEANDAYLEMFRYTREELDSGKLSWDQMTPPEYHDRDRLALEELAQTGAAAPWEKEMLRKDGSRVPILIGVSVLHESEASRIAYIVDLSTRRLLEAQFRQAQKMEAVGQLAGGVAHDFNNLLTTIIGYGELVLGQLPSGHPAREEILEVLKAGERAAVLTRQLLAFSRKQILAPVVLDLNKVVTHLQGMLKRLIGEQIELSTVLEPRLACIRADSGQLEQIIVNLVVNARDAMPGGGRITIETSLADLTKEYAQEKSYVTPGPYVRLMVSDTGTGMDAETRLRIFEPFFTTKEQGKGTGLGLSMVYGIVKQSGGSIEVQSELGKGTSVHIYFPVTTERALEPARARSLESTHGTETILLVEDEDGVRSFVRRALQAKGYAVLEASNAESAIEIARTHAGAIGLLLTDTVMPGLSGPELAVRLAQTRPEMKILFISGYTDDAVLLTGVLDANAAFLQKPFSPSELGLKIRELLSETKRQT